MSTAIETSIRRRDLVFGIAFITRLLLFQFSEVTDILASRVEVVTPITSFTRLTEGLYLFQNGVPPYDGGVFHQAPLLLAFFQPLSYLPDQFTSLIYILIDLLLAYLLSQISRIKQQLYKDLPRVDDIELIDDNKNEEEESSWVVAGLYLFNPFTIATCLSKSTITFTNLSIALGTFYSLKGNKIHGCFWIAMATYLSFYPLMLIIPITMLLVNSGKIMSRTPPQQESFSSSSSKSITISKKIEIAQCIILYIGWLAVLLLLSFILVESWDFLEATYGVILLLPDLTPNIGGIMAVFKSYPSIGDASFYLGFLPIYSEIVKYMRYNFFTTNIFLYSSLLAPIFYHLWIYAGSGNANFFYAITLVYSVGNIILLVDATFAMLRREFDVWNPKLRYCEVTQR
ncbi:2157_t:CDS:2 [Ambispora leptoticha]|uniref:2157_t:CDS:1 n=1 Tax=Ambispora leptoticha TaxID=144679 RepID=A0A9N8V7D0_9GLOM|nr:2157_t:CDS:2 [Ambispora leptoticha]